MSFPPPVYTVTQLTTAVRATLERAFPDVWVEGEISNLRTPASGHVYFSLKDQDAQMRAVAFRRVAASLPFQLEDGLMVLVKGHVSVYEPRGDYQILVESLEPKGIGALQIAFEQLKKKLDREGLFDPALKRPLPFFPERVGVVTSGTGAVLHDVVTVLRRRCPVIGVHLFPVAVQGPGAARQIAEAIRLANRRRDVDVLIVGRGGGSLEDLWSFNEEVVVRAIADSRIPIISAVGHAVDVTLADFAADAQAPTPSAAAESISPVLGDLIEGIQEKNVRLFHALRSTLRVHRNRVELITRTLPDPVQLIQREVQRVDGLGFRLTRGIRAVLAATRPKPIAVSTALLRVGPGPAWQRASTLLQQLVRRLHQAMPWALTERRHRLRTVTRTLHTLSPLAILSRGYSIIQTSPGDRIVTDAQSVQVGDRLRARLAEGRLICLVEKIE